MTSGGSPRLFDTARLPRNEAWLDDAPCAGQWWLFDTHAWWARAYTASIIVEALPALALCERCPFTAECLARVAPRESKYDGVAGGRVYRNGKPVHTARGCAA